MSTVDADGQSAVVTESWRSITTKAGIHIKDVFLSGLVVAAILALFRLFSGNELSKFAKFEQTVTEHVLNLPMFVFDMALFVAALSIAVSVPWGPALRRHVVKPILQFMLHTFGVAAGFILVIWGFDSASYSWISALSNFRAMLSVELLALGFGFILAFGAQLCDVEIDEIVSNEVRKYVAPRFHKLLQFFPLPLGVYFMWLSYQDLVRLSLEAVSGH